MSAISTISASSNSELLTLLAELNSELSTSSGGGSSSNFIDKLRSEISALEVEVSGASANSTSSAATSTADGSTDTSAAGTSTNLSTVDMAKALKIIEELLALLSLEGFTVPSVGTNLIQASAQSYSTSATAETTINTLV